MKRLIVIIFIVFGAFLTFSLYRTFAYDTSVVEETPSTTDLEYTFKIGNSSIKQITVDSGETKYYDVVLGNPNPAKISYGVYYEMVSPSSKPDGFSIEYTSKSTGESTGKVDKEGNITLNLVVTNTSSSTVTIKLGTVAGYVNGGELTLSSGQVMIPQQTATSYIESLNDESTGENGNGVYRVHHDAIPAESSATGEMIPATDDYRYYGASPNNYVCLDKNSDGTCEDKNLYRIIGSMREDSDGTYKVKVIKATPLTTETQNTFLWDCVGSLLNLYSNGIKLMVKEKTTCGSSENVWNYSSIMEILNDTWLNGKSDSYDSGGGTYTLDFTEYGLSDDTKNLIRKSSRYYLGGYSDTSLTTMNIYNVERENVTSSGNSLYWDGTIGLLYPSDYGYASGQNCVVNFSLYNYPKKNCSNWLYDGINYWTMTPYTTETDLVWYIINGYVSSNYSFFFNAIYPTFYLDKDVLITGGIGSKDDPYVIK